MADGDIQNEVHLEESLVDSPELALLVQHRLESDLPEVLVSIDIVARGSQVALLGAVRSLDQRDRAERLTRSTDGVTEVINMLVAQGSDRPSG